MKISPLVDEAMERSSEPLRLGIMGGTFDPIHFGHLICAEQAREQFELDWVVFMPTGNPVFKMDRKVSDAEHRYNMVVAATRRNPRFDVSRMEIDRGGATYTYDTLKAFNELTPPGTQLFFITGADAIGSVLKWRNADKMLEMAHFVAATRPGYDLTHLHDSIPDNGELPSSITFFEVPGLAISSTDLRRRVSEGKSIAYMTQLSVADYIKEHHLYEPEQPSPEDGEGR